MTAYQFWLFLRFFSIPVRLWIHSLPDGTVKDQWISELNDIIKSAAEDLS